MDAGYVEGEMMEQERAIGGGRHAGGEWKGRWWSREGQGGRASCGRGVEGELVEQGRARGGREEEDQRIAANDQ